jgi:hypothetical protein
MFRILPRIYFFLGRVDSGSSSLNVVERLAADQCKKNTVQ